MVSCQRSDCSEPATATLTYDYGRQSVWLRPIEADREPGAWPICTRHADHLRVPMGWMLHDNRGPVVALFNAYAS